MSTDVRDGAEVAFHDNPPPHRVGEQRQGTGDAVGDTEIRMPAWGRQAGVGVVKSPPAREQGSVDAQRLGQPNQVTENPPERVASGSVLEQELADPGQAVKQVVFGECRHLTTVYAR
jgi:hypothetical protein